MAKAMTQDSLKCDKMRLLGDCNPLDTRHHMRWNCQCVYGSIDRWN